MPAIALNGDRLRIAATATLEALRRPSLVADRLPMLAQAIASVAALGVRHAATIAGNLNWTSGDLIPLLLALDAQMIEATGRPNLSLYRLRWTEASDRGLETALSEGQRAALPGCFSSGARTELRPSTHLTRI